jgi:ABC-type multidrug transport system fused ATPase/permease subunit
MNVNELMLHIKKITETKHIYKIFVSNIIPTAVVTISLIYNFMKGNTKTGIIVIIILIVLMLLTAKLEFDSVNKAHQAEEYNNILYDEIHEIMTNIDTVVTSDTKTKEMVNITEVMKTTYDKTYTSEFNNITTTYGLQLLSLVAIMFMNYLSYDLYTNNKIDSTVLVSNVLLSLLFLDYYEYSISAIRRAIPDIGKMRESSEYFAKYKILEDEAKSEEEKKTRLESRSGAISKPRPETRSEPKLEQNKKTSNKRFNNLRVRNGDILFKNITIKYDDKLVIDDLDLHIKGNKTIGIIGPIGSGKSTLLKTLAGITKYKGTIYIDGQKINDCTHESIANNISYISQHPKLFNKSIYHNINYGSNYTKEEIQRKINDLGLNSFLNNFPNRLDTMAGKEGTNLSGGQKHFVSLIRSLVQNKSIILLDEPSSSLDKKHKELFIELIAKLDNKTIIITTHDKDLHQLFDNVIDMKNI